MDENRFLDRYVLGEGFPWEMGIDEHVAVALSETALGFSPLKIDFPKELWNKSLPKYRLVLERIDE